MKRFPLCPLLVLFALAGTAGDARASSADSSPAIVDTVILGNDVSEKSHHLQADKSEKFQGGLDQSARQLLPSGTTATWESAPMTFTMRVDPRRQNYFTVKLWGSDKGEECGRLILFANGLQVGYRDQADYDVLNQTDEEAEAPGRFIYQTSLLPLSLTQGKTSLSLKIVALGRMWPYGTTFAQYQKPFTQKTRGIYRLYTHTDGYFVPPASEKQGSTATAAIRPAPGGEVIEQSRQIVLGRLKKMLAAAPKTLAQSLKAAQSANAPLLLLAQAYKTPWTPAANNPAAIDLIVSNGDAIALDLLTNPETSAFKDWHGAGALGDAIVKTWPAIGKRMDEKIAVGPATMTRGEAWAKALRASVDFWRTHRRPYTNQSMIVDYNIYIANRGLELIDPKQALPESQALDYLYQATGIKPWLGSDPAASADAANPSKNAADVSAEGHKPYGSHYCLVTQKGLSRELGYVAGYGETILRFVHDMVVFTGDEKLRHQFQKIADARFYFRYPGVDADGYRCMKLASEIDNRGAHYPLSGAAYNAPANRENWWMDDAALLNNDPKSVGAAQQGLADNQYFSRIAGRLKESDTLGMMLNIDDYATVKALAPSSWRLPMSDGQPDFVFSDEEDAVLAIKHGTTRLFINLYFRAEAGVNRVARVFEITPTLTRIATVRTQVDVNDSGQTYVRPDWIDGIRSRGLMPPGQTIHQAWAAEKLPIAKRPADATLPPHAGWGPFLGKASFYQLRYGNYLIGLNTTEDQTYPLTLPSNLHGATDLVSGKKIDFANGVKVGPLSTVVFYLPR